MAEWVLYDFYSVNPYNHNIFDGFSNPADGAVTCGKEKISALVVNRDIQSM